MDWMWFQKMPNWVGFWVGTFQFWMPPFCLPLTHTIPSPQCSHYVHYTEFLFASSQTMMRCSWLCMRRLPGNQIWCKPYGPSEPGSPCKIWLLLSTLCLMWSTSTHYCTSFYRRYKSILTASLPELMLVFRLHIRIFHLYGISWLVVQYSL